MVPQFIDKEKIPHKPGVYIFKDEKGKILYVGKAIDLNSRVSSYFSSHHSGSFKTEALIEKIRDIDTILVESELEALILEANLIKKYLPSYNISLKDDKDYLYIKITKEPFPRVITARKQDLKNDLKYFGPFPSSRTVRETLKILRRVFPWCSNPPKIVGGSLKLPSRPGFLDSYYTAESSGTIAKTRQRPCFYFHLRLCPGACVGQIDQKDYRKIINRFMAFLEGKKSELVEDLTHDMEYASKEERFEDAAFIKRLLGGISYLIQPNRTQSYLENPNFLEDERQKALEELQQVLALPSIPERIECYDISNIQGTDSTGSMVVLTHGEVDKSQYRRFKIKITGKPNDYAMHAEMMGRRLKNDWPLPDLIIIDGGRGQVRAVNHELRTMNHELPIYGLAKRMEWLYPPEGEIIKLPQRSPALNLLKKIRDESHRFAITYHRKLRSKSFFEK